MNEISVRQAYKMIKSHPFKNGDIIAIKAGTPLATKENVDTIAAAVVKFGYDRVIVAVVGDFDDLKVLDENAMIRRGWINVETAKRLVGKASGMRKKVSKPNG